MSNISNHETFMTMALEQAAMAAALGEVPVGAVLVTEDGQCFTAHNAPISKHDASAHAEMEAIRKACTALGNYRLTGSTLYVTLEPCLMCSGAIIHARIAHVVYGASDKKTGAVSSLYQTLADERLNHQPIVTSGILDKACSDILKSFFKQRRHTKKTLNKHP